MLKTVVFASLAACMSTSPATGTTDVSGGGTFETSAFSGTLAVENGSNQTLGWTVSFTRALPGTDCIDVAEATDMQLSIVTDQVDAPNHHVATLTPGDLPITNDLTANSATMTGGGFAASSGTVTITSFSNADIRGSLTATGTDLDGNAVQWSGTFDAPSCGF